MTVPEILSSTRAEIAALTINPLAVTISGNVAKVDHAQKLIVEDALAIFDKMAAKIEQAAVCSCRRGDGLSQWCELAAGEHAKNVKLAAMLARQNAVCDVCWSLAWQPCEVAPENPDGTYCLVCEQAKEIERLRNEKP